MTDTIFALSSGAPPAAIGVIRISGPRAGAALQDLAGGLPPARKASLKVLRGKSGAVLDQALVLWFPGPETATGEDCAELHCHGGRAVIAAVRAALGARDGLREAAAGEFTRRAFANGKIDLAQAEALGDLLTAETELQRQIAQQTYGGTLSRRIEEWRSDVLGLSAAVEAVLDFGDEDDVEELPPEFLARRERLRRDIEGVLAQPRAERLRDGVRVVLAGPPNSGKSSLFNRLLGESAAIIAATPGTTRDVIERPVALGGVPFTLIDTAGLREAGMDPVEAIGITKAKVEIDHADLVLWLGEEGRGPVGGVEVQARSDDPAAPRKISPAFVVSSVTGEGIDALALGLIARARDILPKPDGYSVNRRQAALLQEAVSSLDISPGDHLILAESLRATRKCFDQLLGRTGVEDMLDALFGRFCIGK